MKRNEVMKMYDEMYEGLEVEACEREYEVMKELEELEELEEEDDD